MVNSACEREAFFSGYLTVQLNAFLFTKETALHEENCENDNKHGSTGLNGDRVIVGIFVFFFVLFIGFYTYSWIKNDAVVKLACTVDKTLFAALLHELRKSSWHCGESTIKLTLRCEQKHTTSAS